MTDNERLFGPLRRKMLEPIEDADALTRALNAPGADLGLHVASDGAVFRVYRTPVISKPLFGDDVPGGVWSYRVVSRERRT